MNSFDWDKIKKGETKDIVPTSETKTVLYPVINMYKIFYGSKVDEKEPSLKFFIKPFTFKILLPSIIGSYKVFGKDIFEIKMFLGNSNSEGEFVFPSTPHKKDGYGLYKNLGILKNNELSNFYSVEIIPENNKWKKWVRHILEKGDKIDNFKLESDNTIYVYAFGFEKNGILESDFSSDFWHKL
jgi:hypothetical protein